MSKRKQPSPRPIYSRYWIWALSISAFAICMFLVALHTYQQQQRLLLLQSSTTHITTNNYELMFYMTLAAVLILLSIIFIMAFRVVAYCY